MVKAIDVSSIRVTRAERDIVPFLKAEQARGKMINSTGEIDTKSKQGTKKSEEPATKVPEKIETEKERENRERREYINKGLSLV